MAGTHKITHISFPNMEETEYHDITSGIAEGSLLLDEILQVEGLNLGEVNSNKFEVQLYGISDVSGQKILVWQVDIDTSVITPIFTGYVDSCKQNQSGYYRDIIAYDVMYQKSTVNVSDWWNTFWDEHSEGANLKTIRTSLLSYVDITEANPNEDHSRDGLVIHRLSYEQTLTFSAVLKMICEIQATIPNINRSGNIEFIKLNSNTYTDQSDNINRRESIFEEFSTQAIDVVWVYDSNYNVVGFGGSGSTNPYKIAGNLLFNGINEINPVAAGIYEDIKDIIYTPGDIRYIIAALSIELGNLIKFGTKYTYVFENILSGPILIEQETKSGGSQYLQESSNWNSDIASLQQKVTNNEIQYYLFSNNSNITIGDGEEKKIIDIRFTSNSNTIAIFQAEILLDSDTTVDGIEYSDNELTVKYIYNDVVLDTHKPKERYYDGEHVLHLLYYFTIQRASLNHIEVWFESVGGVVDIDKDGINACVYGQNLAVSDIWDGTITIKQIATIASLVTLPLITGIGIGAESISTQFITPDEATVTQIAGLTTLIMPPSIMVMNPTETISVSLKEVTT